MGIFDKLFGRPTVPTKLLVSQLAELQELSPFPLSAHFGAQVETQLLALRADQTMRDLCPVIIGDFAHAARLLQARDDPFDMAGQLQLAKNTQFDQWIAQQKLQAEQSIAKQKPSSEGQDYLKDQSIVYSRGVRPMTSLSVGYNTNRKPHIEVFIAYLPTPASEDIPLHLHFGEWNDCPSPYVHAAAARYWKHRFGAEIVTQTSAVIEYTVVNPPQSEAEALELAWQHYFYCADQIEQNVGSVATHAKALLNSTRWHFWWD